MNFEIIGDITNIEIIAVGNSICELVVCQIHFDGYRDAINRHLYRESIHQLFIDRLLPTELRTPYIQATPFFSFPQGSNHPTIMF